MNSVKASFAGGVLHSTDYFSSRDHEEGRAWLVLSGCDWHVLLPRIPASRLTVAHARPVTDCHELDGWRWRLELGRWHMLRPMMPVRESVKRSRVCLVVK